MTVTNKDLKQLEDRINTKIGEAVDAIMAGVEKMHEENIIRFNNLDKRMDRLERKVDSIEDNVRMNTTAIDDLGIIIATRPTIKDFNKLKAQVIKQ